MSTGHQPRAGSSPGSSTDIRASADPRRVPARRPTSSATRSRTSRTTRPPDDAVATGAGGAEGPRGAGWRGAGWAVNGCCVVGASACPGSAVATLVVGSWSSRCRVRRPGPCGAPWPSPGRGAACCGPDWPPRPCGPDWPKGAARTLPGRPARLRPWRALPRRLLTGLLLACGLRACRLAVPALRSGRLVDGGVDRSGRRRCRRGPRPEGRLRPQRFGEAALRRARLGVAAPGSPVAHHAASLRSSDPGKAGIAGCSRARSAVNVVRPLTASPRSLRSLTPHALPGRPAIDRCTASSARLAVDFTVPRLIPVASAISASDIPP